MPKTKANIFFRVINNQTESILNALRTDRLPVTIWMEQPNLATVAAHYKRRDIQPIEHSGTASHPPCYIWDVTTSSATVDYGGIRHMVYQHKCFGTDFIMVDSNSYACNQLVVFHDCTQDPSFPETFYKIPVYNDYSILKQYIDSIPEKFTLKDNPQFNKTSYINQGQTVYREDQTGRYWVLDNLHKSHYEVFDSQGIHIGDADLDGNLDSTKQDKKKKLDL